MNINPISFGKKIPLARCKVLDNQKQEFVDATFFEYDCKDHKDSIEVSYLSGKWAFRQTIATGMERKFRRHLRGKFQEPYVYYGLQRDDGKILGLCNTCENHTTTDIEYITRDLSLDYRYIGQTMLAQLAKQTLVDNKKQLVIRNATNENQDLYEYCGFKMVNDRCSDMIMGRNEMRDFVVDVEDRTKCSIF